MLHRSCIQDTRTRTRRLHRTLKCTSTRCAHHSTQDVSTPSVGFLPSLYEVDRDLRSQEDRGDAFSSLVNYAVCGLLESRLRPNEAGLVYLALLSPSPGDFLCSVTLAALLSPSPSPRRWLAVPPWSTPFLAPASCSGIRTYIFNTCICACLRTSVNWRARMHGAVMPLARPSSSITSRAQAFDAAR